MIMRSMDWNEVVRRVADGEPVEDVLDEKNTAENEEFRRYLAGMGPDGPAALARHDARMRDLDLGLTGARNAWHSISNAQKGALLAISEAKAPRIIRRSIKPSVYVLDGQGALLCRVATVRNLCAHELLAWDGGAFDPEAAAVLTERGRFVIVRGRSRFGISS